MYQTLWNRLIQFGGFWCWYVSVFRDHLTHWTFQWCRKIGWIKPPNQMTLDLKKISSLVKIPTNLYTKVTCEETWFRSANEEQFFWLTQLLGILKRTILKRTILTIPRKHLSKFQRRTLNAEAMAFSKFEEYWDYPPLLAALFLRVMFKFQS